MARCWMRWRCGLGVVFCALVLAGCYFNESHVPVVTDAHTLDAIPLQDGYYCAAWDPQEEGELTTLTSHDDGCLTLRFVPDGGVITVVGYPSDQSALSMGVMRLGRGVFLVQAPATGSEDDDRYELMFLMMTGDGFAVLPPVDDDDDGLVKHVATLAERNGVGIDPAGTLTVQGGAPDDVLAFLREVLGARFDGALRDEVLGRRHFEETLYFVRIDDSRGWPDDHGEMPITDADLAVVDDLQGRIGRAMTLE